ncbi:hypothetical protein OHA21_15095 [Actinoplanes sp. NBC_00393]|uniref:hypothetical protein n=1 Tax=Actinoplanes sp. NBC_00393 TaxID=2975953 RepID=UPI002E21BD16
MVDAKQAHSALSPVDQQVADLTDLSTVAIPHPTATEILSRVAERVPVVIQRGEGPGFYGHGEYPLSAPNGTGPDVVGVRSGTYEVMSAATAQKLVDLMTSCRRLGRRSSLMGPPDTDGFFFEADVSLAGAGGLGTTPADSATIGIIAGRPGHPPSAWSASRTNHAEQQHFTEADGVPDQSRTSPG